MAAEEGHADVVQILLSEGADVNELDSRRMTPLHLAVLEGHAAVIQMLVDAGADIRAADYIGFTPSLAAIGDRELAELLKENGAAKRRK